MTNTELFEIIGEINKCPVLREVFLKALGAQEKTVVPPPKEKPVEHLYRVQVEFSLTGNYEVFATSEEQAKEIAADLFHNEYGYTHAFYRDEIAFNGCKRID